MSRRLLRFAGGATLLMVTAGVVAAFTLRPDRWWTTCAGRGCPTESEIRSWHPSEGGQVIDRNGQLLAPLLPTRRENVALVDIPMHVRLAFVAVEDRRFFEHDGIDWRGVTRAAWVNVKAGGVREGASTITMQLARNVFLSSRLAERSMSRKLLEWRYAQLLERYLTKEEILERYLNAIYLGNGVYGVEGAAQDLFGKSVSELRVSEAALLAGLTKAPTNYSPRNNPRRAKLRRDVALAVMRREGVIGDTEYLQAVRSDIPAPKAAWRPERPTASWATEYARAVIDSLREVGEIPREVRDGQLIVYTTIDARAQEAAERAIERGAAGVERQRRDRGARGPEVQGALVALDPVDGAVRALVGGRGNDVSGFDRATRARRQPGSAFKPFVYAAALQQGFTAASMVDDEPIAIPDNGGYWQPANYEHQYYGRLTMRDALRRSLNVATVRLSRDVGLQHIVGVARAQGITSTLPMVPSLALGVAAVTPIELTAAYAAFGNGGMRVTPHVVLRVDDVFGRTLWRAPPPMRSMALAEADAFIVTSMLRSVVDQGTGYAVRSAGIRGPVAGKTGTTNDGADVWFVGFTPTIVASVWFGNDRPRPLGVGSSGGSIAAPAWAEFVQRGWHSPEEDAEWTPPPGVVERWIDVATGMRADEWCGASRREWFKMGSEPIASCTESMRYSVYESYGYTYWDGDTLVVVRDSLRLRARDRGEPQDTLRDTLAIASRVRSTPTAREVDRMLDTLLRPKRADSLPPLRPPAPGAQRHVPR